MKNRLGYLDSTRAIAALMVLFFHVNRYLYESLFTEIQLEYVLSSKIHYFIGIIFNGQIAVSYFFVLSGFVLSLYYFQTKKEIDIKDFAIKRLFRIVPLYWSVVLVAYLIGYKEVTVPLLVKELLLLPDIHEIVLPGWTMTVELIVSLLVPFLIILVKRLSYKQKITLVLLLLLTNITNKFVLHFVLGVLLADFYIERKGDVYLKNKYLFFALGLFFLRPIIEPFPLIIEKLEGIIGYIGMDIYKFYYLTSAVASFLIILKVLTSRKIQKILNGRWMVKVGEISYGIYLIHWLVIYGVLDLHIREFLYLSNPLYMYLLVNIFVLIITLFFAYVAYLTIEKPFIKIGKKVLNKI